MERRRFLSGAVGGSVVTTIGCLDRTTDDGTVEIPSPLEDRPGHVYRPTHASDTRTVGTATVGEYGVGLLYSYPSRFWDLNGRTTYEQSVEEEHSIHLMAIVWDAETRAVLPEAGVTVNVLQNGDPVTEGVVYSMLSQRMGFHYGDNIDLPGDGDYTVRVSIGGMPLERTGRYEGRFTSGETTTFELPYRREDRNELTLETYDDSGTPGAVERMNHDVLPTLTVPDEETLPGETLGVIETDDAVLSVRRLRGDASVRFGSDDYLAVFGHTPYNRMVLPMMGLRLRIERDGRVDAEEILTRTMDPELGYHYGVSLSTRPGDTLRVETLTPPQTARHEGFETAFVEMSPGTVEL